MSLTQTVKDAYDLANALANAEQKSELLGLLVNAREQAFELQEKNRELKKQIESHDRFEENMKDYRLVQVSGCTVYQHKTESYYVCPHCVECKKRHFLQPIKKPMLQHGCPACKNLFPFRGDR